MGASVLGDDSEVSKSTSQASTAKMDLRMTASLLVLLLLGLCNAQDDHGADNEILPNEADMEDITETILRMNDGSPDFLLEGDVLIPRTRTAMKCFNEAYTCLWPKSSNGNVEIPFLISEKSDDSERREILDALEDFESKTCIRFIPRASQRQYLSIEPRYGCFSMLGRIGDKQVLSLQKFGCVRRGIIQHGVLHALGFYHEHTRSDRDEYIRLICSHRAEKRSVRHRYHQDQQALQVLEIHLMEN